MELEELMDNELYVTFQNLLKQGEPILMQINTMNEIPGMDQKKILPFILQIMSHFVQFRLMIRELLIFHPNDPKLTKILTETQNNYDEWYIIAKKIDEGFLSPL